MTKGILDSSLINRNPVWTAALGLCPALAVTTSVANALAMGFAVLCVLAASNASLSWAGKWIPERVRLPCAVIAAAAFASMADILMKAFAPALSHSLGIYVPLIAVNCIVLDRAESFAFKNKVKASVLDGIAAGLGFIVALVLCGAVRELFGSNSLFGVRILPGNQPMLAFRLACGGFFSIALVLAAVNWLRKGKAAA